MSSDNSIIILKSPRHKKDGFDYRVIHAMAIQNIYWDDKKKRHTQDINPKYLLEYFDKCEVMTENGARMAAVQLEREVGYVEYGISEIEVPKPFEYYRFVVNRKVAVPV